MKPVLFSAALLVATMATAQNQDLIEFKVTEAIYSEAHIKNPGEGALILDYKNSTVSLVVERKSKPCFIGGLCPRYLEAPFMVKLPITSVVQDSCGTKTVVAQKDQRPVDGQLQQLKVVDHSSDRCMYVAAQFATAEYKTSFVNRMTGKEATSISKMQLAIKLETADSEVLVSYKMNSGFSPKPSSTEVTIDNSGKVLKIQKFYKTQTEVTSEIAQLSQKSLESLKAKIAAIDPSLALFDPEAGTPYCLDVPSASINILVNQKQVEIYKAAGCHKAKHESFQAESLIDFLLGLAGL